MGAFPKIAGHRSRLQRCLLGHHGSTDLEPKMGASRTSAKCTNVDEKKPMCVIQQEIFAL